MSGPICRWLYEANSIILKLDVMPLDENVLGFSNRWYRDAISNAYNHELKDGLAIKVVSPVYFLATKFEAFVGRGSGDYFSHDMEDIIFVMENRSDFILELASSPNKLRSYFSIQAGNLLNDNFLNILPGLLMVRTSLNTVLNMLKVMASWQQREK